MTTTFFQDLWEMIKRINLRIDGVYKGCEIQIKGRENLLNEIIAHNFLNPGKDIDIQL
jgi:hypothetical protein